MRTLLCLLLAACAAPSSPSSASVAATGWIDDENYPISGAWVYAKDNENTHWEVVLTSKRGFPAVFAGDLRTVHVDFGGEPHAVDAIGGSPDVAIFEFGTDEQHAAACAKQLGTEARGRVDPGLVLRAQLVPSAAAEAGGAPRIARFVLENGGQRAFTFFDSGPEQAPRRDERFELTIERDGVALQPLVPPVDFGGMRWPVTLEPGAEHTFELELGAWTNLDPPGLYRIRAQLRLEVRPPASELREPYSGEHLRWDATAAAECQFRVG